MSSNTKRLLNILESGRQIRPGTEYIDSWKTILNAQDLYDTYKKIGLLHALVKDAATEARQHFPDEALSIDHWESQLSTLLRTVNAGAQWQNFFGKIDPHTFSYLKLQSKYIESQIKDKSVDNNQLQDVRKILAEALEEIVKSKANPEIVIAIARRVRLIISSIDDFMITGNEAIFDQLKAAAVEVASFTKQGEEIPASDKLANALGTLANAITVVTGAPQIVAPTTKYLLELLK